MPQDYFAHKAQEYENNVARVSNVYTIADAILERISYDKQHAHIMDFGSGTGLLTSQIAPFVHKITTVDISFAMNEVLRSKIPALPCVVEVCECDLVNTQLEASFDGIISSMTIHHVQDVPALMKKFYVLLKPHGTIALADLDKEDGSFHSENTGVFHFGFDQELFASWAKEAGFQEVKIDIVSVAKKPYGEYPIFLLTGRKPA